MTPDDLRPLLTASPFERFFLNVSDGSSYEVTDPAQVTFPSERVVRHEAKGRAVLIALTHVVCVGFPSAAGDSYFLRGR